MRPSVPTRALTLAAILLACAGDDARAGGWPARRPTSPRYQPTTLTAADAVPYRGLGSFSPTPYTMVRGNGLGSGFQGGGYSPLGTYGDTTLVLYGPLSSLRATAAPVTTYTRGYDGSIRPSVGTSFSYPFQPDLSPVVYPTWGTSTYGVRRTTTPPWWNNGINWVDQN